LGQNRTFYAAVRESALPPKADIGAAPQYVRFGSKAEILCCSAGVRFASESGHHCCSAICPLSAKSGHLAALRLAKSKM